MAGYRFPWQSIFWLALVSSLGFALVAAVGTGPLAVRIVFGLGAAVGIVLAVGAWRSWHAD